MYTTLSLYFTQSPKGRNYRANRKKYKAMQLVNKKLKSNSVLVCVSYVPEGTRQAASASRFLQRSSLSTPSNPPVPTRHVSQAKSATLMSNEKEVNLKHAHGLQQHMHKSSNMLRAKDLEHNRKHMHSRAPSFVPTCRKWDMKSSLALSNASGSSASVSSTLVTLSIWYRGEFAVAALAPPPNPWPAVPSAVRTLSPPPFFVLF